MDNAVYTIGKGNPFAPKQEIPAETTSVISEKIDTADVATPTSIQEADFKPEESVLSKEELMGGLPTEVPEPEVAAESTESTESTKPLEAEAEGEQEELANVYYTIGNLMKSDKILPEDVEIPEGATGAQIYDMFKQANQTKLETETVAKARAEFMQTMSSIGANEKTLKIAMALEAGTDPNLLYEHTAYEQYANLEPDETSIDKQQDVIRAGLVMSGLNIDKANKYIDALLIDGEESVTEEFMDQQVKFKAKHDEFLNIQSQKAVEKGQRESDERKSRVDVFQKVMTDLKIKDQPLSPSQFDDLQSALYEETEVVVVEGTEYRGTKFQKFLLEDLKNFETQLYLYNLSVNREGSIEAIKSKATIDAQRDFMNQVPSELEFEDAEKREAIKRKNSKKDSKKSLLDFGTSVFQN